MPWELWAILALAFLLCLPSALFRIISAVQSVITKFKVG